jgi:hypothetical protein
LGCRGRWGTACVMRHSRSKKKPPDVDLHALATIEAWQNPRFKAALEQNPRETLAKLAARYGVGDAVAAARRVMEGSGGRFVVAPNPAGMSPAERRRALVAKEAGTAGAPTSKIELTPEQREAIKQATGQEIAWLELTPDALQEGPVAPGAVRAGMGIPYTWEC